MSGNPGGQTESGRWIRRGGTIIVLPAGSRWSSELSEQGEVGRKPAQEQPTGRPECAALATGCQFMTPEEEKRIKKSPNRQGAFDPRAVDNPETDISLHLSDYDVNDWRIVKPGHVEAMDQVLAFIRKRARETEETGETLQVTLTGAASHTGSREYNDLLARKRASCAAFHLCTLLQVENPSLLRRIRFNPSGEGFDRATCRRDPRTGRNECELPEFRSVLVQVHAPGRPPKKVPVVDDWDRYAIRCCSYRTENLFEVTIGALMDRGFDALPESVRRLIPESLRNRGWVANQLRRAMKRIPRLGKLLGQAARFFPAEVVRDTAVFQIRERDRAAPKIVTLCYEGFGIRIPVPRPDVLDGIVKQLPPALRDPVRRMIEELIPPGARRGLPELSSTVPGPFKPFALNRRILIREFAGSAQLGRDALTPGRVTLMLGSEVFTTLKGRRAKITPESCGDCAESVIPVQVGPRGDGFELFGITQGSLREGSCRCGDEGQAQRLRGVPVRRRARV